MESKRGVASHFGTIIRIISLIILVAVITFFVVKFFRDRSANKRAEQTASQAANKDEEDNSNNAENERNTEETRTDANTENNNQDDSNEDENTQVPRGIADGNEQPDSNASMPTAGPAEMPAAGTGAEVLIGATFLSTATYIATRYKTRKSHSV